MPGFAQGTVDDTLPPAAQPGATPTSAPDLSPGQGGPGSYPSGGTPPMDIPLVPPPDFYGYTDSGQYVGGGDGGGRPTDQQVIDQLGYDPGDPRNNLSTTGSGTSVPTRQAIGTIATFLGNAAFPGLGRLTGPIASKITQMIQNGASQRAVQNAIQQHTGGGGGGGGTSGGGFDFGKFFGGPGYSDPAYLKSIGYGPGQGTGSLWPGNTGNWGYVQDNPGTPENPNPQYDPRGPAAGGFGGGVAGGGGSFFHGNIPGGRASPQPGAFAGLGSFSGGGPIGGETWGNSWGNINSPLGRAALSGVQFDPAKMPNPGFQIPGSVGPGNAPIINWAAFGQGTSPGQSVHFLPKSVQ